MAMGNAERVSDTVKGLKAVDKMDDANDHWLFKLIGDYNKLEGKCAHKLDGEEIFDFGGILTALHNVDCDCP